MTHKVEATVPTAFAARYAQQFVKHFGHHTEASWENNVGQIKFDFATLKFTASDHALDICFTADELIGLSQAKAMTESHLHRWAHKEELPPIVWNGPETPPPPPWPPRGESGEGGPRGRPS